MSVNKVLLAIIIVLTLLLTVTAHAQTIPIRLIAVKGENSFSCKRSFELFNSTRTFYKTNFGISLKPISYRCLNRVGPRPNLIKREMSFYYWAAYFYDRLRLKRGVLGHAILPPIKDSGRYYLWGRADITCGLRRGAGASVSMAEEYNDLKQPRSAQSLLAINHEIGHSLGAYHDNNLYNGSWSFMHEDALSKQNIIVSERNRRDIKSCVSRK